MKVYQFMTPMPVTLKETYSIKQAAKLFQKHSIDGAPVLGESGKITGIFTKTHLYKAIVNEYDYDTPVNVLMKSNIKTINANRPASEAWQTAQNHHIGRLPVVDDNDNLLGMMTRTNLVRAFEKGMLENINQLNAILDSAHNGIYAINKDKIIITFNKAAEHLTGLKPSEVLGRKLSEFTFDLEIPGILEGGQPQYGKKVALNGNLVIVNRTPIISGNFVIGAVAIMQDISELESISKELSETTELYEELNAVLNSSYDGMLVVDKRGQVIQHNSAYEKMGLRIDKTISDISLEATKKSEPVTLVHSLEDDRQFLLTANPVHKRDRGKISRVVVNCRDISELNNLRRQLETNKELSQIYHLELESLRTKYLGHTMVCNSQAMRNILDLAVRVARVDTSILILGESGVGKDVVTSIIHKASKRSQGPFIRINCGAIPENLLESELFGYEPGAFTGASKEGKPGLLELAHGGTLFFDEVAELTLPLQVKLLTVLQEREVTRLGSTKPTSVDIRVIAATNKNLETLVRKGQFRPDLYYRLNVVPITIPPLRKRQNDIPFLIIHFLRKFNERYNLNKSISADAMDYLISYDWPGNVRELENLIERLAVITAYDTINSKDLPTVFLQQNRKLKPQNYHGELGNEKELIEELYQRLKSTRKVAEALGIHQSTVVRKMKKYKIKTSAH